MATDDIRLRQAELRVDAACYAVGAIGFLLEDNGYTDAQKLAHIVERIETLNTALGLMRPAVQMAGEAR
jgi:hypothetical protein